MHPAHRSYPAGRLAAGIIAGFLLLATPRSGMAAQQDPTEKQLPSPAQGNGQTDEKNISIDVVVADKLGHPLRGLQASDFTLLDNKQPRKLVGFRALDTETTPGNPVHVVIVVDMINTPFDTVARERGELAAFLKEDGGKLGNPTSISIFTDKGLKLQKGSTLDGNALLANFNTQQTELRVIGRGTGIYGAAEQLEMSLSQLGQLGAFEATQPGRKMILMISPGWQLLARAGDQADMKQRTWVFNSIVQLTNGLREAHIALYCLDPYTLGRSNPYYYQSFLKPIAFAKDAEYPHLALQVLAQHSGGQVLTSGRDITGELNDAVRDAGASYELTFEAVAGDRPNEYHALQVQVDRPSVLVRTAAGYYANTRLQSGAR
jgi:VWFA-related protein